MPASLTPSPAYLIPGQSGEVTFTDLNAATTHVELFITRAPVGSALQSDVDKTESSAVRVHSGERALTWLFEPDKGGVYTFSLREHTRQPASGARFAGDTRGAPDPVIVAVTVVTLSVGELLELRIGPNQDVATLKLYVWGDTIRATTLEQHGKATPILEDGETQVAANAVLASSVTDAVDAVAGSEAYDVLGDFAADFELVRLNVATHFANTTSDMHENSDVLRALGTAYTATDLASGEKSVNALYAALRDHMAATENLFLDEESDPPEPFEPTHIQPDGTAYLLSPGAGPNRASQYLALADIIVALEVHKALTTVHAIADESATVTGSPLLQIFSAYLRAIRESSPVTPPDRNTGAALLEQFGGFTRDES